MKAKLPWQECFCSYGLSLQSYDASLSVCVCVGPGSDCRDECIQTEDKDSLRELRS